MKARKNKMNEQSRKMELLGTVPVPKALLALGLPTMIGMLINALYNLADTFSCIRKGGFLHPGEA